jgi:hypothetical protein
MPNLGSGHSWSFIRFFYVPVGTAALLTVVKARRILAAQLSKIEPSYNGSGDQRHLIAPVA